MSAILTAVLGVFVGPGLGSVSALKHELRLGKCRSLPIAGGVGAVSAGISVGILWVGIALLLIRLEPASINRQLLMVSCGASLVASGWVAATGSVKEVKAAKFCEGCESYMAVGTVAQLDREMARKALRDLRAPGSVLLAAVGKPASVLRFRCDSCDHGYTEMTVAFEARWPRNPKDQLPLGLDALQGRGKYEKLKANWLAFSCSMPSSDFALVTFVSPPTPVVSSEAKVSTEAS